MKTRFITNEAIATTGDVGKKKAEIYGIKRRLELDKKIHLLRVGQKWVIKQVQIDSPVRHVKGCGSWYDAQYKGILIQNQQINYVPLTSRFYEPAARLPALIEVDCLIVLGGPMSVNDEEELPWLRQEKRFIAEAIVGGNDALLRKVQEVIPKHVNLHLYPPA